jgi:hypothetical protein
VVSVAKSLAIHNPTADSEAAGTSIVFVPRYSFDEYRKKSTPQMTDGTAVTVPDVQ